MFGYDAPSKIAKQIRVTNVMIINNCLISMSMFAEEKKGIPSIHIHINNVWQWRSTIDRSLGTVWNETEVIAGSRNRSFYSKHFEAR